MCALLWTFWDYRLWGLPAGRGHKAWRVRLPAHVGCQASFLETGSDSVELMEWEGGGVLGMLRGR